MNVKNIRNNPGIYIIECLTNSKYYVGSTVNLRKRLLEHKRLLNKNKHVNSYLQRAVNKYGIDNFKAYAVEVPEFLIRVVEQAILDLKEDTYNLSESSEVCIVTGENHHLYNQKLPEYWRKAISEGKKGIQFTPEHCKNISKGRRGIPAKPEDVKKRVAARKSLCNKKTNYYVLQHYSGEIKTLLFRDWKKNYGVYNNPKRWEKRKQQKGWTPLYCNL